MKLPVRTNPAISYIVGLQLEGKRSLQSLQAFEAKPVLGPVPFENVRILRKTGGLTSTVYVVDLGCLCVLGGSVTYQFRWLFGVQLTSLNEISHTSKAFTETQPTTQISQSGKWCLILLAFTT